MMSVKTAEKEYRELTEKGGQGYVIKKVKGRSVNKKYFSAYIILSNKLIGKKVKIELVKKDG